MVVTENPTPQNIVERNIALTGQLINHFLSKPELLEHLPDDFELLIFPDDDAEMRQYNLGLLDQYTRENKPLIFVRIKSSQLMNADETPPNLYVPIAIAA